MLPNTDCSHTGVRRLFATSVYGQTAESGPGTLESQVERVKAENAALREQLLKIEEQQKELLELIRSIAADANPTTSDGVHPSSGSAGQRRLCHRQSPRRLRPRKQLCRNTDKGRSL